LRTLGAQAARRMGECDGTERNEAMGEGQVHAPLIAGSIGEMHTPVISRR